MRSMDHSSPVLSLDDPGAADADLAGAKAANLARARRAGLPTLPGMVLTTVGASDLFATGDPPAEVTSALWQAWETLSDGGRGTLVVRSSSTLEDAAGSSMAGRFTSLLDVRGWPDLLAAVRTVLDSATSPELSDAPMAVLLQPHLAGIRCGGVLFGADPVTGNAEHLVVAAVDGGPDRLVSGEVDGTTTTLTRHGRRLAGAPLPRRTCQRLARLARQAAATFGGPQDVEWALDARGRLWLLQSRPITTPVHHPSGPRLGPGPVAETLPGTLSPLEVDLWVGPLRAGLTEALRLSGSVPPAALRRSPVVVTVAGQVAVDLDLLEPRARGGLLGLVDPRPGARRLRAAWRVGRLRAALADLGRDLVGEVDAALLEVPPLPELDDRQLAGVLQASRTTLTALHGHEVLAGLLLDGHGTREPQSEAAGPGAATGSGAATSTTGAAIALQALAEGRAAGLDDTEIVERDPAVLALVPPQVGPPPRLPVSPGRGARSPAMPAAWTSDHRNGDNGDEDGGGGGDRAAATREALRMRVRWVQELSAAAAWELGRRFEATGRMAETELVRWLTFDELTAMAGGSPAPLDLPIRGGVERLVNRAHVTAGAGAGSARVCASTAGATAMVDPLPASFRLAADGAVVPDLAAPGGARGAGGGHGRGRVHVGSEPPAGAVLVVRTLDPGLAPILPGLAGLVAETGSPLSHLAILAREHGVPTVVGLAGALDELHPGDLVEVDGATGTVTQVTAAPSDDDPVPTEPSENVQPPPMPSEPAQPIPTERGDVQPTPARSEPAQAGRTACGGWRPATVPPKAQSPATVDLMASDADVKVPAWPLTTREGGA